MECLQNLKVLGPAQSGSIPILESEKTWLWDSIWSYIVLFIFWAYILVYKKEIIMSTLQVLWEAKLN